jgi:hypothetical protein
MLAEHAQSYFLIFILNPTDNTCFLKQPFECTQSNTAPPPLLWIPSNATAILASNTTGEYELQVK